jgi:hypothetical protein
MKVLLAILVLAAGAMAAAAAEPEPSAPVLREKCGADIKKFCSNVKPGEGRVVRCLQDNEAKLSQPCKDARNAMRRPLERPN